LANEREDLLTLARLYGVQTSYRSAMGHQVEAHPESLLGALRERREELAGRIIEPVIVAWDGHAPSIELRPGAASGSVAYHLDLEGGERRAQMADLQSLPEIAPAEGSPYPGRRLALPEPLPFGYHQLTVELGGRTAELYE